MPPTPASLTIVVPTRDEPDLGSWLAALQTALRSLSPVSNIVIVDDSSAALHEALRAALLPVADLPIRVIRGNGRGKGDAVRLGMIEGRSEVIMIVDADTEVEWLPEIGTFVDAIGRGEADVVIAERQNKWQYRNVRRFALSYGLFFAQRILIFQSRRFFDTQCGFKAFRGDVARGIAGVQKVRGGMFDIEYLYIALKNGLRVKQVPFPASRESRPSRLRLLKCLRTDPPALIRVKLNGILGRYRIGGGA